MSKGFRPTRRRRSELATPASSEKMIAKAADSKADLIFLDLEDAVAPQEKQRARANVVEAFRELNWGNKARACRINAVETRWCYGDVIDVVSAAGSYIDILIIPKVKSPRDVWFVDDLLTQVELAHDLEVGRIGLEVLIEETEALARVDEIAASSPSARSVDTRRWGSRGQPGGTCPPHRRGRLGRRAVPLSRRYLALRA